MCRSEKYTSLMQYAQTYSMCHDHLYEEKKVALAFLCMRLISFSYSLVYHRVRLLYASIISVKQWVWFEMCDSYLDNHHFRYTAILPLSIILFYFFLSRLFAAMFLIAMAHGGSSAFSVGAYSLLRSFFSLSLFSYNHLTVTHCLCLSLLIN